VLKKSDGILDLMKAADPLASARADSPTSPTSAAPVGGGGGASAAGNSSAGAPAAGAEGRKRGGKYIKREWVNGSWKYTYQDDPSEGAHGFADAFRDTHSVDALPQHHNPSEDNANAEEAYRLARQQGPQNEPGKKGEITMPATGQNFTVELRKAPPSAKHNWEIKLKPVGPMINEDYITGPWATHTSKATPEEAWDEFNTFMRLQLAVDSAVASGRIKTPEIKDNITGRVHGRVVKVAQPYDKKTNRFIDPKGKKIKEISRGWKIVLDKGSFLYNKFSGKTTIYAPNEARIEEFANHLNNAVNRISSLLKRLTDLGISTNMDDYTADSMKSRGMDTGHILASGALPIKAGRTGPGHGLRRRAYMNDWGSDENRLNAMRDIAREYGPSITAINNPKIDPGELSNMAADPADAPIVGAIGDIVDTWHPDTKRPGHTMEYELKRRVQSRVATKAFNVQAGNEGFAELQRLDAEARADVAANAPPPEVEVATAEEKEEFKLSPQERGALRISDLTDRADSFIQSAKDEDLKAIANQFKQALSGAGSEVAEGGDGRVITQTVDDVRDWANRVLNSQGRGADIVTLNEHLWPVEKSFRSVVALEKAILAMSEEEYFEKANFTYSHKEGNDMYPRYVYKDEAGNVSTRGNAPQGHADYNSAFGDAADDAMSPENAPQFYSQDGRKLSRAPYTGADVQWNRNYHRNDPENLWAARWVNPVTGDHEYSYIDSDLRGNPQFQINRQNSLTDNRLPHFRQYVAALFKSNHQKDKIVAVALALLDQGRFRVRELMALKVGDVKLTREILTIGKRKVYGGPNLVQQLGAMISNRDPGEPLFMVAPVSMDGDMDYSNMRRIGPHFIVNLLEEVGVSAESLQTYHASQTYSVEIQRVFGSHNANYDAAHHFALLEVASEMGHDLGRVEDFESAIYAIESAAVDPIVVQSIKQSCEKMGIGTGGDTSLSRFVHDSVPQVSMVLTGRNEDEEEFSRWLRTVPVHNFQAKAAA